jgi:LCP family protein required for cell wall assembly
MSPTYQVSPPTRPRTHRVIRRNRAGCLSLLFAVLVACGMFSALYFVFVPVHIDILILGVDARPGEGYVTRTDSIMIAGVQPRAFRVNLLSIPRDLFVDTPGFGVQRVNTINVLGEMEYPGGGIDLLRGALAQSFGITPERYIRLNFEAFVSVVDAVGGVDIEVGRRIVDSNYPTGDGGVQTVVFEPGWQHMDGQTALVYARTRYSDDDYFRAGRQQQVIDAVMRKLVNPLVWIPAFIALESSTDSDLNILDYMLIAPAVLLGGRERLVVDRDYITPVSGGAAPDYLKLAPWLDGRFD